jgi:phage head maturation protease
MSAARRALPSPSSLMGNGAIVTATFPIDVANNLGDIIEVAAPGLLDTQAENNFQGLPGLPPLTFQSQHDPTVVYASTGNGSLAASVTDTTFTMMARLPATAELLTEQIATGVYQAISPSFMALDAAWDIDPLTEMPRRTITEMYLVDLSAVATPAWQGTTLMTTGGSRSLAPTAAESKQLLADAERRLSRIEQEDRERIAAQHEAVAAQLLVCDHQTTQYELERLARRR